MKKLTKLEKRNLYLKIAGDYENNRQKCNFVCRNLEDNWEGMLQYKKK